MFLSLRFDAKLGVKIYFDLGCSQVLEKCLTALCYFVKMYIGVLWLTVTLEW